MQTFKYLRLQGCVVSLLLSFYSLFVHFCVTTRFPADKISILSTYNGQKHLIRDVIAAQCAQHPLYGEPNKITTVDRFQGQQNDSKLLEHNSVFSGDTKGSARERAVSQQSPPGVTAFSKVLLGSLHFLLVSLFFQFSFPFTTWQNLFLLFVAVILVSLVRTKTVGHVRDVRRLVVAMSRSRLGL